MVKEREKKEHVTLPAVLRNSEKSWNSDRKKCKMTRGGGLRACRANVAVALSGLMCAIMCGSAGEFVCNVLIVCMRARLCMFQAAMYIHTSVNFEGRTIVHGYICSEWQCRCLVAHVSALPLRTYMLIRSVYVHSKFLQLGESGDQIYTHSLFTHTTVGDKMAAGAAAHERSQGDKALMEGKLAVALKHFEKAVQMNGDDHLNWYKRATAYIIEKRYDAALKDLGKVIEMKADYAQAYDKRAKIFTSQGMCNKARIVQQKLRQLQALLAAGVLY